MKKILITGKGSYIGTMLIKWLEQWPDQFKVEEISVRGEAWKQLDFSVYDSVLHVAGIAHVSADKSKENEYYRVNRDLAIKVANKAKKENVGQFIFMSSIIVYGGSGRINKKKIIDVRTAPNPSDFYGDSKLQAENGISILQSVNFNTVILRLPMIYGQGSAGNYSRLAKVARVFKFFPNISNERSMLHIDNLCEFIRLMIINNESGLFFPQNTEYVNTSKMVKEIAINNNKQIVLTKSFNWLIDLISMKVELINKVFGNLVYEKSISKYKQSYCIRDFKESIRITEGVKK